MDEAVEELLGPLGGVVLGFVLSQTAQWFQGRRGRARIRNAARHLVLLEVRKDWRLLSVYWEEVKTKASKLSKKAEHPSLISCGHAIADTPFPALSASAWNTHLAKVTEVFSVEEISSLWDFYEDLSTLERLYEGVLYLRDSADARGMLASDGVGVKMIASMKFQLTSEHPVASFKTIIESILNGSAVDRILDPG